MENVLLLIIFRIMHLVIRMIKICIYWEGDESIEKIESDKIIISSSCRQRMSCESESGGVAGAL